MTESVTRRARTAFGLAALVLSFGAAGNAFAFVTIDIGAPTKAGSVEFKFSEGGITGTPSCSVSLAIPGGTSALAKAGLIESALVAACSPNYSVIRVGTEITVVHPAPGGAYLSFVRDGTGQSMAAASTVDDPAGGAAGWTLRHRVKLGAASGGGTATFVRNGESHTVPTTGKTNLEILQAWKAAFGAGVINLQDDTWTLDRSVGLPVNDSFGFEILDSGLEIEVTQEGLLGVPTFPAWLAALFGTLLLGSIALAMRLRSSKSAT